LLLQGVAGLPGRKIRLYELLGQVTEAGDIVSSDRVMAGAESLGLGARHGRFVLGHALKIARHLVSRNRKVPVICPTSIATRADPGVCKELSALVNAEKDLTEHILFKLSQRDLRDIGPIERDTLDAIRDLGFRYVMDEVLDLRFDPRRLAAQGVGFAKIQIGLLMSGLDGSVATEIHPHDIAGLFARHGITLIASDVGTERVALELHDYSATLAQGAAFGEPRPVRLDVIEAAAQATAAAPPEPSLQPAEPAARAEPAPPAYVPLRSHLRRSGT
jgi:cyclic-di-GMP phosphodiesterase, flagellum assembly factor TipF